METYYVHDNGARSFRVEVETSQIAIYKVDYKASEEAEDRVFDKTPTYVIEKYLKVYVGKDPKDPFFDGNSLLVHVEPHKYIFIGWDVLEITTPDEIVSFSSPVGGSDVPYPYAIGERNTYLLIEDIYIPNYLRDETQDPYDQLYGPRGMMPSMYAGGAGPKEWCYVYELSRLYEPIRQFYHRFMTNQRVLIERP